MQKGILSKKHFLKLVIFWFDQKPLHCTLSKGVKAISKPNQSKTTKAQFKIEEEQINSEIFYIQVKRFSKIGNN